jgi:hypothetical protein
LVAACYEEAVDSLLEQGKYSGAMWAARLSVVKEGRLAGEQLTSRILRHPEVKRCLAAAEMNPKTWLEKLRIGEADHLGRIG